MLCPPGMGGKLATQGEPWALSADELWRAAPALARQARRYRLAQFGGSPARRCLSEPLDSSQLSQFVKEEHAACRASDRHRYNFDFETMQPLEGRFCWQPISPPPLVGAEDELDCWADEGCSPDGERPAVLGVALGPQTVLVRPAPELGRRCDGAERVPGAAAAGPLWTEAATPTAAPLLASSTDILRIGKRPSAFSRCDGRRAKLAALCVDRDQPGRSPGRQDHPELSDETEPGSPSP